MPHHDLMTCHTASSCHIDRHLRVERTQPLLEQRLLRAHAPAPRTHDVISTFFSRTYFFFASNGTSHVPHCTLHIAHHTFHSIPFHSIPSHDRAWYHIAHELELGAVDRARARREARGFPPRRSCGGCAAGCARQLHAVDARGGCAAVVRRLIAAVTRRLRAAVARGGCAAVRMKSLPSR